MDNAMNKKNKFLLTLFTSLLIISNYSLAADDIYANDESYSNFIENNEKSSEYQKNVGMMNSSVNNKQTDFLSKKTPNAAEQGYYEVLDPREIEDIQRTIEQANNDRQRGVKTQVFEEANPVIKDKNMKMWIKNWILILEDVGVSRKKTLFEAKRLNKEDFEDWANGIYRAKKEQMQLK